MSSEWPTVEIASICEGIFDGPHATPKKTDQGPVFLGISALNSGRLDLSSVEHLSEDDFVRWTKRVVPAEGDIVFSYETRLGEVAMIPAGLRCCLGRRMALMRIDRQKALPEYVLYAYMAPAFQEVIRARTIHGSTVDRLPLTEFGSFPIPIPSLETQRSITSVLQALDDRITLLRETNATLEAIAQALFKSWFVDFDPVRARMEGRAPEGMDEATAALFPDGFEESALGLVPRGWRVGCVDDICKTITNGGTPSRSKSQFWEGGSIPWFKTGEFSDSFLLKPSEFITQAALGGSSVKLLPKDAILMAIYAAPTVGRLGILTEAATFNQACTGMVAKDDVGPWFLFWTLFFGRDWFNSRANGAAQQNISKAIVAGYRVPVPPASILAAFNDACEALHGGIRGNATKAQTLATLRDTLLPRLISGQLRLPEAPESAQELLSS